MSTHDFPDKDLGKAIPYGVYDLAHNEAGVTVGISHDTAEFAAAAIHRWWTHPGVDMSRSVKPRVCWAIALLTWCASLFISPLTVQGASDGDGSVAVSGELRTGHTVTVTLDGPYAQESDSDPNPFVDRLLLVEFSHESGGSTYTVPGYFAADGHAAESSAEAGTKWRAHLAPDKAGRWSYVARFYAARNVGVDHQVLARTEPSIESNGSFVVEPAGEHTGNARARGRLQYVGKRYLEFAGTGEFFLKVGADSPETLLAYREFDGTHTRNDRAPLKSWEPHVRDWQTGDPTWKDGRGKGLVGAINYLSSSGVNAMSFLTYNAGGDGNNVWPFVAPDDKLHYDCSKLDQWALIFEHATDKGMYLHFKLQEQEMDDNRRGSGGQSGVVRASLDGGALGPERKVYLRELVARFGHNLALNWNLGEENSQSTDEVIAMAKYLREVDPYDHPVVIHTFPDQQDKVYSPLLGERSDLTGASLQNGWQVAHRRTLKWITESARAGRAWVVCNDEQNPANFGVPADRGYAENDGSAGQGDQRYTVHDIRKYCLWGTLMAGGGGVEYYFGYELPENDLLCEDFRSREQSWKYGRIALEFFRDQRIPLARMQCHDELVGNGTNDNSRYCLAAPGQLYLIYLPQGGTAELTMREQAEQDYLVQWFNPREGGDLLEGEVTRVTAADRVSLGDPPADPSEDWLVIVRRVDESTNRPR